MSDQEQPTTSGAATTAAASGGGDNVDVVETEKDPMINDGQKNQKKEKKEKEKSEKPQTGRKYMKRTTLTILLGILNVFLLAILCFIIAFFVKDKSQRVIIKPSRTFCLPCDEISIHPDDDPINFQYFSKRHENGRDICCADDGQNLDKLMELYVEKKHAIKSAETNTQELEAACRSKVDDFEQKVMGRVAGVSGTKQHGTSHLIQWTANQDNNDLFFKRNITYNPKNGEFVITKSGYYYVYSQVTLKVSSSTPDTGSVDSMCHYLYLTPSSGTPRTLLENSRTRCKFQGPQTQSTSYIGAVFNLMKDDTLMIKVSKPDLLEKGKAQSYFGLHMI